MSRLIAIEIVAESGHAVYAFNKVAAAAQKSAASIQGANARMVAASQKMAAWGSKLTSVGKHLTVGLTLPLVAAGAGAFKMADDYETSLSRIRGLAGQSAEDVEEWGQQLLELGPKVGKGPRELAEALYFVASAGLPAGKAMSVVEASAKAAAAGLGDTQTVADAVTSVMNAYGPATMSAAHATDVLVAMVREGKGEANEFAPVIGNVVAYASKLNVRFEEVGAALAAMTQLGTDPAKAATQLQAFFSSILKETPKAEKELGKVGLSFDLLQKTLQTKGIPATLELLKKAFKGNTAAMAEAFPNIRAFRGILGLVDKEGNRVTGVFKRMSDSQGSLAKAFNEASRTSGFSLDRLKASIEALGISLGAILQPVIAKIANWLTKVSTAFMNLSPETKKWVVLIAALVAALGPALIIIGSLVSAIAALLPVLGFLIGPWGLLVIGVVALAAAIAAAVLWPDKLSGVLQKMGLSAEDAEATVKALQEAFKVIKAVVAAVFPYIVRIASKALDTIASALRFWIALIQGDWSEAWSALKDYVRNSLSLVGTIFTSLMSLLWKAAKSWGGKVVSGITDPLRKLPGTVGGFFVDLWGRITGILTDLGNWLKKKAINIALFIIEPFSHLPWKLGEPARKAKDALLGELHDMAKKSKDVPMESNLKRMLSGAMKDSEVLARLEASGIGTATAYSIIKALNSKDGELRAAGARAVQAMIAGAKVEGKISSPSKKTEEEVGKPLAEGIIAGYVLGIKPMTDKVKASIQEMVGRVRAEMGEAAKVIGIDQAKGVIRGFLDTQPSVEQQMKTALREAVREALRSAREAVVSAREEFASAFGELADAALSAFDSAMSGWVAPSQKILDQMDIEDQLRQINEQIASAAEELRKAQEAYGQDPNEENRKRILDAERAYREALRAQQRYDLQQRAAEETAEHEKKVALKRKRLEGELAELERYLKKHPEKYREVHGKITKLLKKLGVDSKFWGTAIGISLADGIEEAIPAVTKACKKLARKIQALLKLKSPAEEGPLADLDLWWKDLVPTLLRGADTGKLERWVGGLAGKIRAGFIAMGDSKDDLRRNFKEFTGDASEWTETTVGSVGALRESLEKLADEGRLSFLTLQRHGRELVDKLPEPLRMLGGVFENLADKLLGIKNAAYAVRNALRDTVGEIVLMLGTLTSVHPAGAAGGRIWPSPFAAGGIVTAPTLALIGERGPEAVVPLRAMGSLGGGGAGQIVVNVQGSVVSERDLIDAIQRGLIEKGRRTGAGLLGGYA